MRGQAVGSLFLNVIGNNEDCRQSSLDEIDRVLAQHYGLTDEELDFIPSTQLRAGPSMKLRAGINYDIKYRMGRETAEEPVDD